MSEDDGLCIDLRALLDAVARCGCEEIADQIMAAALGAAIQHARREHPELLAGLDLDVEARLFVAGGLYKALKPEGEKARPFPVEIARVVLAAGFFDPDGVGPEAAGALWNDVAADRLYLQEIGRRLTLLRDGVMSSVPDGGEP